MKQDHTPTPSADPAIGIEAISALMDGQLQGAEQEQALTLAMGSAEGTRAWHDFHVLGDVLRSPDLALPLAPHDAKPSFVDAVMARVAAEPAWAPADAWQGIQASAGAGRQAAANDAWAWKLTASLASLVAVVAVAWSFVGSAGPTNGGAQLAQTAPPAAVQNVATNAANGADTSASTSASNIVANSASNSASTSAPQIAAPAVMIRDPRLDELLAAHRQFGGTSALQAPAGVLRNANSEVPNR